MFGDITVVDRISRKSGADGDAANDDTLGASSERCGTGRAASSGDPSRSALVHKPNEVRLVRYSPAPTGSRLSFA